MSTAITTMANALIDFILSLLRDPEVAAEFDAAPEAALTAHGMQGISYNDLCAVLPMVYDHPQVAQRPEPSAVVTPRQSDPDVIRELRDVINNNAYITNNSTLVDQSVNQNIWAEGDVMQLFDNEAVIASGEGSTAAGGSIVHDSSQDSSTTITAGGDAVVDNDIDVTTNDGSFNQQTDGSTTDNSTTTSTVGAPAPAPEPEPEPAADPMAEAATYADQEGGALPETAGYDEAFDDDDY
ncbi:IniB N-terminal domain-containing protein [Microbacterium sp. W1N]|uniref:IniB N-terminal domain-containing protein n=1 Tax=Microbacterium festucae TaxID=2977531 RepID=UPI0021BDF6A0|nr:IniB N-terminal domain-containing protein [Microbacterium festucae]MCT9818966.1 IniB N-terminal domain-containing protein [Microbacterium festucae]